MHSLLSRSGMGLARATHHPQPPTRLQGQTGQGRVNHLCPRTKQACGSRPPGSETRSVIRPAGPLPPVLDLGLLTLDLYIPPPQQPRWTPVPMAPIPQGLPNSPSDSAALADARSSGE